MLAKPAFAAVFNVNFKMSYAILFLMHLDVLSLIASIIQPK